MLVKSRIISLQSLMSLLLAALALLSVTSRAQTANSAAPTLTRIGPGDMLTIKAFDVPELEQEVRVTDLGEASFSLIGSIQVAGMTTKELQAVLEHEYSSRHLLLEPHITVMVTEYATQGVSVFGEVKNPGTYPLIGPHTLLNLISTAGGVTQSAGDTIDIAHRDGSEQTATLDANNGGKTLGADIRVQPGDRIMVSRAAIVYVVGDVAKPGGYTMQNNGKLTVLQAIALASGVNRTAALSHAKIIHETSTGYQEGKIDLNKLMHGNAPDIALAANDILFVPNSKLKTAVANSFATALQSASAAAIYRP